MTAPTLVGMNHTTGGAQTDVTIPACAAGDLIVVGQIANSHTTGDPTWTYVSGGASAGLTVAKLTNDTVTRYSNLWYKVAAAGDVSGSVQIRASANDGTGRIFCAVFNHASGWNHAGVVADADGATGTIGGSPYQVADHDDVVVGPGVTVMGIVFAASMTAVQIWWNGVSTVDPQWDESVLVNGQQAGYYLFDSGTTLISDALTAGHGTNKAVSTVVFVVAATPLTAAPTDPLGLADSRTVAAAYNRTVTDSVGLADSRTVDASGASSVTINDQIGVTDTVDAVSAEPQNHTATKTDQLGLEDVGYTLLGEPERAYIFDTVEITVERTITDTLYATDPRSVEVPDSVAATLTEFGVITDTITVTVFVIPAISWEVGAPYGAWRAGKVNPMRQSTESLQFVKVPVLYVEDGDEQAPTDDVVKMAFLPPGATPTDDDWHTATWETITTSTTTKYAARCLVGPSAVELPARRYKVWVRITDNPEQPALEARELLLVH